MSRVNTAKDILPSLENEVGLTELNTGAREFRPQQQLTVPLRLQQGMQTKLA